MPRTLIQLPEGPTVESNDDGRLSLVSGQVVTGFPAPGDYRPVVVGFDRTRSVVAGRLPETASHAEVLDVVSARVSASIGDGVYAAVVELSAYGQDPVVCCRDVSGEPVLRPLPTDWPRERVVDAAEPCAACGSVGFDEVIAVDGSRGGRGGHAEATLPEYARIVACRHCGHEESGGVVRFGAGPHGVPRRAPELPRMEQAPPDYYLSKMTLLDVSFPVYAAEGWHVRFIEGQTDEPQAAQIVVGHYLEPEPDMFAAPQLAVATAVSVPEADIQLVVRQALAKAAHHKKPDAVAERSDAAVRLWFAARQREEVADAYAGVISEQRISIDGSLQEFAIATARTGRWVAVRRHGAVMITVTAQEISAAAVVLRRVENPVDQLLGPEPGLG